MRSITKALLTLAAAAAGCHGDTATDCDEGVDQDCDGAAWAVDCDDGDPRRAPGLREVVGDGVDQDCDGSDHPTVGLREAAAARYASDRPWAQLGWMVACGPDREGDGSGDLAAIASAFGHALSASFAVALPGPVPGEHRVDDVLDLRVEPPRATAFNGMIGIVDAEHGGGLFLENNFFDGESDGLFFTASFTRQGGAIDETTPTLGYPSEMADTFGRQVHTTPYAGLGDLTGDGRLDYALGPVVLEGVPEGRVDLSRAGRLALELNEEPGFWAGADNAIGDLNHDGQDDLVFSSTSGQAVWVVFGPVGDVPARRDGPRVVQLLPESSDAATAQFFDVEVGDVSGDGIDDLVIANGWHGADPTDPAITGIGAVHVWYGPLESGTRKTATADVRFVGELPGAWTGRGLTLADFDGDGTKSLVVGAPASWLAVPGLVYVFDEPLRPGELTAADAVTILLGEAPNANAGFHLAACDTDGDGRDELVVGSPMVDASAEAPDAGVFYWLDALP